MQQQQPTQLVLKDPVAAATDKSVIGFVFRLSDGPLHVKTKRTSASFRL
jgi:hypothetical protein